MTPNQLTEPPEGAACPRSHRIVRKAACGIMKLMLLLIVASLIYLAYTMLRTP